MVPFTRASHFGYPVLTQCHLMILADPCGQRPCDSEPLPFRRAISHGFATARADGGFFKPYFRWVPVALRVCFDLQHSGQQRKSGKGGWLLAIRLAGCFHDLRALKSVPVPPVEIVQSVWNQHCFHCPCALVAGCMGLHCLSKDLFQDHWGWQVTPTSLGTWGISAQTSSECNSCLENSKSYIPFPRTFVIAMPLTS